MNLRRVSGAVSVMHLPPTLHKIVDAHVGGGHRVARHAVDGREVRRLLLDGDDDEVVEDIDALLDQAAVERSLMVVSELHGAARKLARARALGGLDVERDAGASHLDDPIDLGLGEALADAAATGQVKVETCGSLFGGRKVFILLKGETLDIGGTGDIVEQYALLSNAHDGTMATTMFPTSTRVVCNNTLTAAFAAAGAGVYRWRHTSGLTLRIEDIKAALATYGKGASADAEAMNTLARKALSRDEIQSLWTDVLVALDGPIAKNPKDESQSRRRQKAVDALADMTRVFDTEAQQFGASAWVAANAATNYIQYHRGTLTGEARANSDLFGAYAEAKRLVMRQALALV